MDRRCPTPGIAPKRFLGPFIGYQRPVRKCLKSTRDELGNAQKEMETSWKILK
jgi:hypothetical protein